MFLGDVVHKEKRDASEHKGYCQGNQIIKTVEDDEFNEMEYDYRGNPLYSHQ